MDAGLAGRLLGYVALLREWNARINLVSRRDTGRLVSYHLVDSLAALRYLPESGRAADIGSGAGLPGIPLALCRPGIEFTLVESSYKKSLFLRTAVESLGLAGVKVAAARAEELPPMECDAVFGRQTGPVNDTLIWCGRHCRLGGTVVLHKTADSVAELRRSTKALARSRLTLERVDTVNLPMTGIPRRFAVLRRA
ncbi:MAG: 16S rRNA (guanine(527)-N(7))-methyltransferase RsmG [bacterium]